MTRVAGSIRVPSPAATTTALRTFIGCLGSLDAWVRMSARAGTPPDARAAPAPVSARRALTLARFLRGLAGDAQRGHRSRLEPLDADLAAALFALAVDAAVDPGKGFVDLAQELALAVAHPEQKG